MRHRTGFTLAEALVAATLGVVVLAVVIQLVVHGSHWANRSDERTDGREGAYLACLALRQLLVDASAISSGGESSRLEYLTPVGQGAVWLDGETLRCREPGGAVSRLAPGPVQTFQVMPLGRGYIRVQLEVARPRSSTGARPLPGLVVDDAIYLPCLANPDGCNPDPAAAIPWSPSPALGRLRSGGGVRP